MLLYGAEAWTLSSTDAAALGEFERNMPRQIFGPVRVGEDYCIQTNRELYELSNAMDVAKRINIQRFRWLGYIVRMDVDASPRQVFDAVVGGRRRVGRLRMLWTDQVKYALTSLDLSNWKRRAQSSGAWREALRQAETRLSGCYGHRSK